MMIKKRGLSVVVASMLLILLAVSGVVIIGGYLIPFTRDSLDNTACFDFRDYFSFDDSLGFNCYSQSGGKNNYVFSVRARADNSSAEKVIGLNVRFLTLGGDGSSIATVKKGSAIVGGLTMHGGISPDIPKAGGAYSALSYDYASGVLYETVEVYPIIQDPKNLDGKVCEKSDSIKLIKCK